MGNTNQQFKRKKILIDKNLQVKYAVINISLMLLFTFIIGGVIYFSIWRAVVNQFSTVKLSQDFETITRMREYAGARQGINVEQRPVLREEAKMLSEHQRVILNKILVRSNLTIIPLAIPIVILIFAVGIIY